MRAVDIIMKKRSGANLTRAELEFLIQGYVNGQIPDYQMAAWAMAVFFRSMSPEETGQLSDVMLRSGSIIDLSELSGPFVDKHSTGGVGDKTSLILAPIVACLGIKVPMMSGRALGHTGGTLDKLDSIPGYRTQLSVADFRQVLSQVGFAMVGQSEAIAPADRKLYALRDVTATVESIPLITSSILSKKVAEGAEALVFDVKFGSGAFMKQLDQAEALAESLVQTGRSMGKTVIALLSDMNEPLGKTVGNFLEVEECLDCLEGTGDAELIDLSLDLAARMVQLAGKAASAAEGRKICQDILYSGQAYQRFLANVRAQGADPDQLLKLRGKYRSDFQAELLSDQEAYINAIDAFLVGSAGVKLGVGRNQLADKVCPTAGVYFHKKRGDHLQSGDPIMTVWGRDAASLAAALPELRRAVSYSKTAPAQRSIVYKEIKAS